MQGDILALQYVGSRFELALVKQGGPKEQLLSVTLLTPRTKGAAEYVRAKHATENKALDVTIPRNVILKNLGRPPANEKRPRGVAYILDEAVREGVEAIMEAEKGRRFSMDCPAAPSATPPNPKKRKKDPSSSSSSSSEEGEEGGGGEEEAPQPRAPLFSESQNVERMVKTLKSRLADRNGIPTRLRALRSALQKLSGDQRSSLHAQLAPDVDHIVFALQGTSPDLWFDCYSAFYTGLGPTNAMSSLADLVRAQPDEFVPEGIRVEMANSFPAIYSTAEGIKVPDEKEGKEVRNEPVVIDLE